MNKKSQKLQTRDFISVGIFSLIYSAVAFIIGGIAQMTPITFPFMPMIVALFTGTVFMLYIACLLYTSPSPRDRSVSRMPSSA